jgi:hypothetical protein
MKNSYLNCSLVFILLFSGQVSAQLVNVEKSRKEAKPGLQAVLATNLALTKNTRQIFEVGTSMHGQYHMNRHTVLLLNNLNFMRVEEDDLINNGFQHLRYNYTLGNGFTTVEAFTQHQYNSIRLLKRRFLLGGGPRFRIYENDNLGFYIAPLVMYEYELLNDEALSRADRFKGDLYVSATYSIDERINFSHTTYYQPDFAKFSEYRISSETGLEFEINDRFAFLITYDLAFDSKPPADIPKLFYTLKNGINFKF